jgi:Signal transduction histidine kinase
MKLFFALMVYFLVLTFPVSAQEDTDVTWFENLFANGNHPSIDDELRLLENRRLEAIELQNTSGEAKALIALGVFHLTRVRDYEQAMGWLIKSLALEDDRQLQHEKLFTLLAMARVFEAVGDYYKSDDFLKQALEINRSENNLHTTTLILNEMGRVSAQMGDVDKAFEDYERVLQNAQQLQLRGWEADALFHLGQLQSQKKNYTEALKIHKGALALRRSLGDKTKEAMSLNEIGELYRLMKNQERALANHEAALEIWLEIKDNAGQASSHNKLGILLYEKKDLKNAVEQLNLALQSGREAQSQEQMRTSYDYLSLCYKELNDFKKALEYKELFLAMEEFIQTEKDERQLLETQNRYTIGKKETEINQLESDRAQREKVIENQHKLRNFLFLLIAFGLAIGFLVLYLYVLKRRSNRQLQEINATKDKLFSIIGHDIKGPLNSLSSFTSLLLNHAESLSKEEIKMLSSDLNKSLKNLFTLLENLLEWSRSQTGNIEFIPEAFDLSVMVKENEELLKGQLQNKELTLRNDIKPETMVKAHRNSINTVVRNLLSNAIKFTPSGGTIIIYASLINHQWRITVADTGVGMSETVLQKLFKLGTKHSTLGTAQEKGTGLGLVLCKEFVEKNSGTLKVESEVGVGSKFHFTLPVQ